MSDKRLIFALALICLSCLCGCASIVHGTTQKILVTSCPSPANVSADGEAKGKTPLELKLKRGKNHLLIVSKEGYQEEQVVIMHVVSGLVAGNIIAGGFFGWGVDALSGAQYRLVPDKVHIELKPLQAAGLENKSPLITVSLQEKLKALEKLLDEGLISTQEYAALRKIIRQ
jgi:hypothetical protein